MAGFGLAYAAGGAADALASLVRQRMLEQEQARLQQAETFNEQMRTAANAREQAQADREAQTDEINKQLLARKAALDQVNLLQTLPGSQQPSSYSLQNIQEGLPPSLTGPRMMNQPPPGADQSLAGAPVISGAGMPYSGSTDTGASIQRTTKPVTIPGITALGIDQFSITPKSLEQVQAAAQQQKIQDALDKEYTFAEGAQGVIPALRNDPRFPGGVIGRGGEKPDEYSVENNWVDKDGNPVTFNKKTNQFYQTGTNLPAVNPHQVGAPAAQMDPLTRQHLQAETTHLLNEPPPGAAAAQSRSDRSYQFSVGQLNTLGKAIDDQDARLSRAQIALQQGNRIGDADLAPALLGALVGPGAGLRMSNDQMNNLTANRSVFESARATAQKLQENPFAPVKFTPAERVMVQQILTASRAWVDERQQIMQDGYGDLNSSDDPNVHRAIVGRVRQELNSSAVRGPAAGQTPGPRTSGPAATSQPKQSFSIPGYTVKQR